MSDPNGSDTGGQWTPPPQDPPPGQWADPSAPNPPPPPSPNQPPPGSPGGWGPPPGPPQGGWGAPPPPPQPGWGQPPGAPGQGYPPPPGPGGYPGYAAIPETESGAIVALVLAIVSWVVCPLFPAIAALIVGGNAKNAIRASGGRKTGEGLITAANIISWINIGLWGLGLVILLIALIASAGSS